MKALKKSSPSKMLTGLALAGAMTASTAASAAIWSSTSILYHQGSGYQSKFIPDYEQETVTVEHASGWAYGDNFFFVDIQNPQGKGLDHNDNTFYGEFSPRFSLSKITGSDFSSGFLKDVSIATTLEKGEVSSATLVGLGFDFSIPNVPVAKMNVYQRFTKSDFALGETGKAPQVTFVWLAPFSIGPTSWVFEGFLDYAWAEDAVGKEANIVTQPRLLMDVGALWGSPKALYFGIEQMIWKNKFGQDGLDEDVTQLTVKWTF